MGKHIICLPQSTCTKASKAESRFGRRQVRRPHRLAVDTQSWLWSIRAAGGSGFRQLEQPKQRAQPQQLREEGELEGLRIQHLVIAIVAFVGAGYAIESFYRHPTFGRGLKAAYAMLNAVRFL